MHQQSIKQRFVCRACGSEFLRFPAEVRKRRTGVILYCSPACRTADRSPYKFSGVYAIEHAPSGRVYVGSSRNIQMRWGAHIGQLRHGRHPSEELQALYTADHSSVRLVILERVSDPHNLFDREQFWMDHYQAYGSGFNRQPRAATPAGRPASEFARRMTIQRNTGRAMSEETRRRIGIANKGKQVRLGKISRRTLTDEQVRYIRTRMAAGDISGRALGKDLGIHGTIISSIARGASYWLVP